MKNNLNEMVKGWFVGDFEPSVLKTNQFEVAVKKYKKGDKENRHVHKIATEITVIVEGEVKMNNEIYKTNDIIIINPNEDTDFECLKDTTTVVVKTPSILGDKYNI